MVGVRREGLIAGYVNRADLKSGVLDDHFNQFEKRVCLNESDSILDALKVLRNSPRVFIDIMGRVSGIVTKGDIQKAPVRMWLFSVISLMEMQFLRLIRAVYPKESWTDLITAKRLQDARTLHNERKRHNEAIDLADCLQFCDKSTIILKNEGLRTALGFESKTAGKDFLKQLMDLRDKLAHSQDILAGRWPALVDLAAKAEEILQKAENYQLN